MQCHCYLFIAFKSYFCGRTLFNDCSVSDHYYLHSTHIQSTFLSSAVPFRVVFAASRKFLLACCILHFSLQTLVDAYYLSGKSGCQISSQGSCYLFWELVVFCLDAFIFVEINRTFTSLHYSTFNTHPKALNWPNITLMTQGVRNLDGTQLERRTLNLEPC